MLFLVLMASRVQAQSSIQSPTCTGVIHGTVFDGSGDRVRGVMVEAWPMDRPLLGSLPSLKTGSEGEYRFEHVCPGTYAVVVSDEKAGYPHASPMVNAVLYGSIEQVVTLTIENPEGDLPVHLYPKPGLMRVHITNRQTKAEISEFTVTLNVRGQPGGLSFLFDAGTSDTIEVPPDKDVICHVTADGFREWSGIAGRGRLIRVQSGTKVTFEAELQPLK